MSVLDVQIPAEKTQESAPPDAGLLHSKPAEKLAPKKAKKESKKRKENAVLDALVSWRILSQKERIQAMESAQPSMGNWALIHAASCPILPKLSHRITSVQLRELKEKNAQKMEEKRAKERRKRFQYCADTLAQIEEKNSFFSACYYAECRRKNVAPDEADEKAFIREKRLKMAAEQGLLSSEQIGPIHLETARLNAEFIERIHDANIVFDVPKFLQKLEKELGKVMGKKKPNPRLKKAGIGSVDAQEMLFWYRRQKAVKNAPKVPGQNGNFTEKNLVFTGSYFVESDEVSSVIYEEKIEKNQEGNWEKKKGKKTILPDSLSQGIALEKPILSEIPRPKQRGLIGEKAAQFAALFARIGGKKPASPNQQMRQFLLNSIPESLLYSVVTGKKFIQKEAASYTFFEDEVRGIKTTVSLPEKREIQKVKNRRIYDKNQAVVKGVSIKERNESRIEKNAQNEGTKITTEERKKMEAARYAMLEFLYRNPCSDSVRIVEQTIKIPAEFVTPESPKREYTIRELDTSFDAIQYLYSLSIPYVKEEEKKGRKNVKNGIEMMTADAKSGLK